MIIVDVRLSTTYR